MRSIVNWAEFEQDCEDKLVDKYGPGWRTEHQMVELHDGRYACGLCEKELPHVSRVLQHCGTRLHINKLHYQFLEQNPLAEIPVEQHKFVSVDPDGAVRCKLCARTPVCTQEHLVCTMHELFLYTLHNRSSIQEVKSVVYHVSIFDMHVFAP